ncbi:MAG: L-seryl-tRNA(Sec) selenium transferase [Actinomycetales bacterium]
MVTPDLRRAVPRTDALLADPRLAEAAQRLGAPVVKRVVREAQQRCRDGELAPHEVAEAAVAALPAASTSLHRVVNATGVVVHTNLGRAPLSPAAREALDVAAGTVDVELDLVTGRRGRRGAAALQALLDQVPEAQDALVVNNNAAALLLTALALAPGREILVSRGELVEIGDGFRIPALIEASGARLREVGTTNRTHLHDFADAVTERTAFVLKVHPSNFLVTGFTAAPSIAELATLGLPVVADIGSGLLAPHPRLPDEPDARTALREGADLVTASGDKLLGGPQAGLLLGTGELVQRLRRHPSARAFRVDKLTLAALEATLRGPQTPVAAALAADAADLRARAEDLAARIRADSRTPSDALLSVVACRSAVGGGGAPGVEFDSAGLALPEAAAALLRQPGPRLVPGSESPLVPVLGRVESGRTVLDVRTVTREDEAAFVATVAWALRELAR